MTGLLEAVNQNRVPMNTPQLEAVDAEARTRERYPHGRGSAMLLVFFQTSSNRIAIGRQI